MFTKGIFLAAAIMLSSTFSSAAECTTPAMNAEYAKSIGATLKSRYSHPDDIANAIAFIAGSADVPESQVVKFVEFEVWEKEGMPNYVITSYAKSEDKICLNRAGPVPKKEVEGLLKVLDENVKNRK